MAECLNKQVASSSLHGIYVFCSELRAKAGKHFTNLFHFESMAQWIKEKRGFNILQVQMTFTSGDQRDVNFQYNTLRVTTAAFQKSKDLGRKLNRVRVGKNIINVILSDRHSRVSPSKQKTSFSRFKQYDQGKILPISKIVILFYRHTSLLWNMIKVWCPSCTQLMWEKSNEREVEFSAQDIQKNT